MLLLVLKSRIVLNHRMACELKYSIKIFLNKDSREIKQFVQNSDFFSFLSESGEKQFDDD
jgi:uncharacterized membrane protein YkgB